MVRTGTLGISLYQRAEIHKLPEHRSQLAIAETIFQTCKTYLIQQGKFLRMLFALIAVAITYYLLGFSHAAEYELTDREIQELRIAKIPPAVVKKLEPLAVKKEPAPKAEEKKAAPKPLDRAAFIDLLRGQLTEQEWTDHGATITDIPAPSPINPI